MSEPISLETLGSEKGVFGAVQWASDSAVNSSIKPPRMTAYTGFKMKERAIRLMKTADALALASAAIMHLETDHRPEFRTTEFPVDSLVIHGQKYSLLTSFNHVAALLDNSLDYDIKDLSLKISLVAP
ncbi:MAG TPA: hypothetical protein DCF45_02095 [Gammaproteobacteria bacterium]|nr:hypothetical protein [Gammaproteobacteria bacterium]